MILNLFPRIYFHIHVQNSRINNCFRFKHKSLNDLVSRLNILFNGYYGNTPNNNTRMTPIKEDNAGFKILFGGSLLIEWCYMGTMLIIVVTQYIKIKYPFRVIRTRYIITISAVIGSLYITSLSLYFILGKAMFLPGFHMYVSTTPSAYVKYVLSPTLFVPVDLTMLLINVIAGMTWMELDHLRKTCVQDESRIRIIKGTKKIMIMGFSCDICTATFIYYIVTSYMFVTSNFYTQLGDKISSDIFKTYYKFIACYTIPMNVYCIYNTIVYLAI